MVVKNEDALVDAVLTGEGIVEVCKNTLWERGETSEYKSDLYCYTAKNGRVPAASDIYEFYPT